MSNDFSVLAVDAATGSEAVWLYDFKAGEIEALAAHVADLVDAIAAALRERADARAVDPDAWSMGVSPVMSRVRELLLRR